MSPAAGAPGRAVARGIAPELVTGVAVLAGTFAVAGTLTGDPVDVEFGPGGGSVPLRLVLTAPTTAADPGGGGVPGIALERVALSIAPLDHEVTVPVPQATGTALTAGLGGDQEVRRVRVLGLELPRAGDTLFRFDQGGVRVQTPRADGDPEHPDRVAVRAVLSAGPSGGTATLPTRGFGGIGPPDAANLYGDQLPGGTTSGAPAAITLNCGTPIRAGKLELRFCTGGDAGPLDLAPIRFAARAEVVHAAPPRGLRFTVGPAGAPVLAWQHDPPLLAPDTVELVPVLGGLLGDAVADTSAGGGATVVVDAELTCAAESRVRLTLATRGIGRTRVRHGREPARVPLAGVGAELTSAVPGDPVPDAVTARLTGSAGPVRRTAGSPSPLADLGRTGEVVRGPRRISRRIDAAALEGRPLVRIGVPAAGVAGEVVVELRADAGGPGPVLARGGALAVRTLGRPRWQTVDLEPLPPSAIPPGGCWIVLRSSAGELLWLDAGPAGDVTVSEDDGRTWRPTSGGTPGLALFVDDPDGPVPPLTARIGAVTGTLLVAPGSSFDAVIAWPEDLRRALPQAPTTRLDCARDLSLEVAELTAGWTAGLELGRAS